MQLQDTPSTGCTLPCDAAGPGSCATPNQHILAGGGTSFTSRSTVTDKLPQNPSVLRRRCFETYDASSWIWRRFGYP